MMMVHHFEEQQLESFSEQSSDQGDSTVDAEKIPNEETWDVSLTWAASIESSMAPSDDWLTLFQNINATTSELLDQDLLEAARDGHFGQVQHLYAIGADLLVQETEWPCWTCLHYAALRGDVQMTAFLLDECPELINVTSSEGTTALHAATASGCVAVAGLLLQRSPLLAMAQAVNGETALNLAASYEGNIAMVEFLLKQDSSAVLVSGCDGWTPLHIAADTGDVEIAAAILNDYPALFNDKNSDGITALELASEKANETRRWKMVDFLLEFYHSTSSICLDGYPHQ
jgi:ankyrin repeat protein